MRSVQNMGPRGGDGGPAAWSERVLERRRALGWTQAQLAAAAGLTQQAVSYVERGAGVPRVTTMLRIARALGTTVEALLPGEPEGETEPPRVRARPTRRRRRPSGADACQSVGDGSPRG